MGERASRPENAPKELNVRLRILPVVVIAILIALALVPATRDGLHHHHRRQRPDRRRVRPDLAQRRRQRHGRDALRRGSPPAAAATTSCIPAGSVAEPNRTVAYMGTSVWDKGYIPGDFIGGVNRHQVAIYNNMTYSR